MPGALKVWTEDAGRVLGFRGEGSQVALPLGVIKQVSSLRSGSCTHNWQRELQDMNTIAATAQEESVILKDVRLTSRNYFTV